MGFGNLEEKSNDSVVYNADVTSLQFSSVSYKAVVTNFLYLTTY